MTNDLDAQMRALTSSDEAARNDARGFNTPVLEDFEGTFERYEVRPDGYQGKAMIHCIFTNLQITKSAEPFMEDSLDWSVSMPTQANRNSAIQIFVDSAHALDESINSLPDLAARQPRLHLRQVVRQNTGTDREGKAMRPTMSYEVVSIGGAAVANGSKPLGYDPQGLGAQVARANLNGCTLEDFHKEVLTLQEVKDDKDLVSAILSRKFVPAEVAAMRVEEREGKYWST